MSLIFIVHSSDRVHARFLALPGTALRAVQAAAAERRV
jgi:hypothetical protein